MKDEELLQRSIVNLEPFETAQIVTSPLAEEGFLSQISAGEQQDAQSPEVNNQTSSTQGITLETTNSLLLNLFDLGTRLAKLLDFDEFLNQLLPSILEKIPFAQGALLWFYDHSLGKLYVTRLHGLELDSATHEMLQECHLSPGEGLAGQAFLQSKPFYQESHDGYPYNTNNTFSQQNLPLFQQLNKHLPPYLAILCLRLNMGQETYGVLELFCAGEKEVLRQFLKPPFLQMLHSFSNLLATTLKNAQIHEQSKQRCRRLDAFDAVVTAISCATDLHDLMQSVLDVVLGLSQPAVGAIFLFSPLQAKLNLGFQRGLPPDYAEALRTIAVNVAPFEEVVRYGQPVLRALLEKRGEGALLNAGLQTCAYLPLLAGGTVVGVLALYGDENLHKQIDVTHLMPLGNQVGFAIANISLYEDSQLERQKLSTVIRSIAEGVVLCDSNGQLILANEAAMELLNLKSIPYHQPLSEMTDFYGIRDLDGLPLPIERLPMARALSGEVFHDYRVLLRGTSGNDRVMSFSGAPTIADNGEIGGGVVILRDITTNQKLERAKDEFLAVAAHELRSPLAAVRGYSDLLLRRQQQREPESPDLRGLTILSQQVEHMLRMVDNLLDVSRLDSGQLDLQLQETNLVALIAQVLDQQQPIAKKRELNLKNSFAELWVACDSLRIRQVLTNLVGNAIKYSPPEAQIMVRLTITENFETEPEVVIAVTDKGNGIPIEQQGRLFERYYRAGNRRKAEGLGLGLYLSRHFVQMHGGRIWIESSEGQGSTFYFTLPMVR